MNFLDLPDEILTLIIEYFHHHSEILNYMLIHPDIKNLVKNANYNCYINYFMTFNHNDPKLNMSYLQNEKHDISLLVKYYDISKCNTSDEISLNHYVQIMNIYASLNGSVRFMNGKQLNSIELLIGCLSNINWSNVKKINIISYSARNEDSKNKIFEELSILGTLRNTTINIYEPQKDGLIYNDTHRYNMENIDIIHNAISELYNGKSIIKFNTKSITEMISNNVQHSLMNKTKYYINDQVYDMLLETVKYNNLISLNPLFIWYSINTILRTTERYDTSQTMIINSTICNNIDKIINNYYIQEYNNDIYTITKYTRDMLSDRNLLCKYILGPIIDELKRKQYDDYIYVKSNNKYQSIFTKYNFDPNYNTNQIYTQICENLTILTKNILDFDRIFLNMNSYSGHIILYDPNHYICYKNQFSPRMYIYLTGSTLIKAMSTTPERYEISDIDIPIYIPNDNGFTFGMSDIVYTFIYKLICTDIYKYIILNLDKIYNKYNEIFKHVRNHIESIDMDEITFIFGDFYKNFSYGQTSETDDLSIKIQIKYRSRTKFIFDYQGIEFEVYRIFSPINQVVKYHPQDAQRCFTDFDSVYFTISCLESHYTSTVYIDHMRPGLIMSKKKNKYTWFKSLHDIGFDHAFRDKCDVKYVPCSPSLSYIKKIENHNLY